MKVFASLFVALPLAAQADAPSLYSQTVDMADILSAVGPGWRTGGRYKAVLLRRGEFGSYAGLAIYNGPFDKIPTVFAPAITTTGTTWGNVPWLEFDENGALLLHNQNIAFGRNKWEQMLTINADNNQYFVEKYTLNAYDTFDESHNVDCTLDLAAHSITINGESFDAQALPYRIKVQYWSEKIEDLCFPSGP